MMKALKSNHRIASFFLLVMAGILIIHSGTTFLEMHKPDTLFPGPGVTGKGKLSDYVPRLKDTPMDTDLYFLKGKEPGGKFLIFGGTHNDEIAAHVSAITLLENAVVKKGELIIIPRVNRSGSTYTLEMEAYPQFLEIKTSKGVRKIRTGARYANWAHQFPDPEVYAHPLTGQKYPGTESRNLNRVYPGRANGFIMEKVAAALIEFINREKINLVLDMHEAYAEHYVVDCLVGHDRAMELVAMTLMALQMEGISIKMFQSPKKVYGFSHRAIGEHTDAMVVLAETTNIAFGKFRGKITQDLLWDGKDPFYDLLYRKGKLFVEYDSKKGISLDERVARHLTTVMELSRSLSEYDESKTIEIDNIPEYSELLDKGIIGLLEPKERNDRFQ